MIPRHSGVQASTRTGTSSAHSVSRACLPHRDARRPCGSPQTRTAQPSPRPRASRSQGPVAQAAPRGGPDHTDGGDPWASGVSCRRINGVPCRLRCAVEAVQLGKDGREFHLQLPAVQALGLGRENSSAHELRLHQIDGVQSDEDLHPMRDHRIPLAPAAATSSRSTAESATRSNPDRTATRATPTSTTSSADTANAGRRSWLARTPSLRQPHAPSQANPPRRPVSQAVSVRRVRRPPAVTSLSLQKAAGVRPLAFHSATRLGQVSRSAIRHALRPYPHAR